MATNVPGLQYPDLSTITDTKLLNAVRNIFDNLFYIRRALGEPKKLDQAQINSLTKQLISQVINSVTNNINITSTGIFITGTHNLRITVYGAAAQAVGTGFFETDRNVIYIVADGPKRWQFAAGVMIGLLAGQPSDLGADDASFLYFATDNTTLYIWDGSAWIAIGGGSSSSGYWSPLTNGDGSNPELVFDTLGNCVVVFTPTP